MLFRSIEKTLASHSAFPIRDISAVIKADEWSRNKALELVESLRVRDGSIPNKGERVKIFF